MILKTVYSRIKYLLSLPLRIRNEEQNIKKCTLKAFPGLIIHFECMLRKGACGTQSMN